MSGGLIGVIAQETARYSMFGSSLSEMPLPEDWQIKWRYGHAIADNTNALIEDMLDRGKDWLWYLADDHAWSPGLLERLLAHELDIVVPLCLMRNPPYRPVIFTGGSTDSERRRVELSDYPEGGLIEVAAAGGAGMLIHRRVFEAMEAPWFVAGRGNTIKVGEDINFCDRAYEAGFKVHCDLDSMLGHCSTMTVWPVREPDGWTYGFSMMGGFQIIMPPKVSWQLADEFA